jgi:hypothetical protein
MIMKSLLSRRSAVAAALGASAAATLTVAGTASAQPESGRGDHGAESRVRHNKRVAVAFMDLAFNKKNPQAAVDRYVGASTSSTTRRPRTARSRSSRT